MAIKASLALQLEFVERLLPVHERDAVHEAKGKDKSDVDTANDSLLLRRGEGANAGIDGVGI
jgi:hypothetical protein